MDNPRYYTCLPRLRIANQVMALSSIQPEHIESIRQWRNAQMPVLRQRSAITPQQQMDYFETHVWTVMPRSQPANILLSCHHEGELIGYGALVHIAWHDARAEVSFLLKPSFADSSPEYAGLFSAYLSLISELAFEGLGLNRLFTETWATRTAHIEVLEGAGFIREGVLREHTMQNGKATHSIIHGRLATEYRIGS